MRLTESYFSVSMWTVPPIALRLFSPNRGSTAIAMPMLWSMFSEDFTKACTRLTGLTYQVRTDGDVSCLPRSMMAL